MQNDQYAQEEAEYDALEGQDMPVEEEGEYDLAVSLNTGPLSAEAAERVQANITSQVPGWRGVRGCNSEQRAKDAAGPVADKWANQTIANNPDRVAIGYGYFGTWRYQNSGGSPGARRCKGWWSECIAYVDFAN